MKTISITEAAMLVPAIAAKQPITRVSNRYQFVSTREILEQVHDKGWRITNATAQSQRPHAQHRITLVHESSIENFDTNNQEGMLRIELFNSHDRTKRLTFAIGYFRLVCSNGLIIASGPAETMKAKHTIINGKEQNFKEGLIDRIEQLTDKFPSIIQKVESLKQRKLTEQEQIEYAKYAINGRYSYRPELPKRVKDLESSALKMLGVRRDEDQGDSAWTVFNKVQENVIRGVQGFTQPVRSYLDNIRVNLLLWKGADATLDFADEKLKNTLQDFLSKQK